EESQMNDEEGISTLPDAKLFENLVLMGLKSTGFNEFSTNIATAVAQQSPHTATSSPSLPPATTETTIPTSTPTEIPTLRKYSRRARISQSSTLPTTVDEPASPSGDVSHGEACPTVSGLEAGQDMANIIKTSALPNDSTPRQIEMATKVAAQDLEISNLKARIKFLKDNDGERAEPSGEDATIKGRSLETGEEAGVERSTEKRSNDTEELVNVLTSLYAANILTNEVQVVSVPPAAEVSTVGIPNGSVMVPTASPIFTTASVVTPYTRCKGKEKMVESDTPKKKKLQEQIDVQVAREIEEKMVREDQRRNEQIARGAKIVSINAEEELQMLIDGLDRNNKVITRHLNEYEQADAELTIGEKIELINELIHTEDQRNYWKIIRLGGSTAVYQFFVDMLKQFDREDLIQLWTLVKETLSIRQATSDKEKELWVELKKLFEPDVEDQL
nr:hypothetical protein [Tanacetum cinerariifolium]